MLRRHLLQQELRTPVDHFQNSRAGGDVRDHGAMPVLKQSAGLLRGHARTIAGEFSMLALRRDKPVHRAPEGRVGENGLDLPRQERGIALGQAGIAIQDPVRPKLPQIAEATDSNLLKLRKWLFRFFLLGSHGHVDHGSLEAEVLELERGKLDIKPQHQLFELGLVERAKLAQASVGDGDSLALQPTEMDKPDDGQIVDPELAGRDQHDLADQDPIVPICDHRSPYIEALQYTLGGLQVLA
jgi:hypothetical protein